MPGALIVGGGLGALRTAESLRASGYAGPITVVGDEPHLPYTRPPLSKEALLGGIDVAALEFRRRGAVDDVTWLLGTPATAASLADRTVTLADGRVLDFDALAIATGIRPRRLPIPGPQEGRVVLRTADDAERIRERLVPGSRVLIMGAGFIGCEVAATARRLGADVSVVARTDYEVVRLRGIEVASPLGHLHFMPHRTRDSPGQRP